MARLTKGQSRLIAIALLVFVIGGLYRGVAVPAWRTYTQNNEEIELHRDRIQRFTRIAANQATLEKQVRDLEQRQDLKRYMLNQESTTLAAAALQERVKAIVEESGGKLASTRVLPAEEQGTFSKVAVSVRMTVSTEALQKVLYELESALPYLFIDDLAILARRSRRARRNEVVAQNLDVRFALAGFMRAGRG